MCEGGSVSSSSGSHSSLSDVPTQADQLSSSIPSSISPLVLQMRSIQLSGSQMLEHWWLCGSGFTPQFFFFMQLSSQCGFGFHSYFTALGLFTI